MMRSLNLPEYGRSLICKALIKDERKQLAEVHKVQVVIVARE
jgi:hypothetical protein